MVAAFTTPTTAAQQPANSRLYTQLKVNELKTLLKQRSKPHSGNKETLQGRLHKCLVAEGHDPDAYYFDESLQGSFMESSTLEQSNLEAVVKEVEEEAVASALLDNESSQMDTAGHSENDDDVVDELENVEIAQENEETGENHDKKEGTNEPDSIVPVDNEKVDDFIDLNVEEKTEKEKEPEQTENNAEPEKVESEKEVLEDYSNDEAPKQLKIIKPEADKDAPVQSSANNTADSAQKSEDSTQAKSLPVLLEKHKDHIVWISKLSARTAAKDLNELGQKKGRKVLKIKILESTSDSSKVAFIIFEDAQMAKDSIKHFNESKINGEKLEAQIASPETVNKLMNPKSSLMAKNEKSLSKWDEKPSKSYKSGSSNYSAPIKKHGNNTSSASSTNYTSKSSRSDDSYSRSSYKYNDSRYPSSNSSSSVPKRPLISHNRYDDRPRTSTLSSSDRHSNDRYEKPVSRDSYRSQSSYRDSHSLLGDQPRARGSERRSSDIGPSSGLRSDGSRSGSALLSNPYSNSSSRTSDSGYGHSSDRHDDSDRYESSRYRTQRPDSRLSNHSSVPSTSSPRDAYSKKYSSHEPYQNFNIAHPTSSRDNTSRKDDEIDLLKREIKNLKEKIEFTATSAQPPQPKIERTGDSRYDGPHSQYNRYDDRQQNYPPSNYGNNFKSPYHADERPNSQTVRNLYPEYPSRSVNSRDQYSPNRDIHNQSQQHRLMEPRSSYDSYNRDPHVGGSNSGHYRSENDTSDFKRLVSSMNSAKQASAPPQEKSWNSSSNSVPNDKFFPPKKYGDFNARADDYNMKPRSSDYSNERASNYGTSKPAQSDYMDGPMSNNQSKYSSGGYRDNFGTSPEKQSSYGKFNVDPRRNTHEYSGRSQHDAPASASYNNSYSGSAAFTNSSSGNGHYGGSSTKSIYDTSFNNNSNTANNNKDLWVNPLMNKPSSSMANNKSNDSMSHSIKSTSAALQSVGRYFSQQQQSSSDQQQQQNKPSSSSSSGSKLPGYYN